MLCPFVDRRIRCVRFGPVVISALIGCIRILLLTQREGGGTVWGHTKPPSSNVSFEHGNCPGTEHHSVVRVFKQESAESRQVIIFGHHYKRDRVKL
jgi:hypothetical protein